MSSKPNGSSTSWPGLDVMNRLFENCKFEAVALREGGLRGVFGSRVRADASFCGFVFDFPCHGRFSVPGSHYLLCHVHQASPGSWYAGLPLLSGTTLLVLPGSSCEMMLAADSLVSLLTAPLHDGVMRIFEKDAALFGATSRRFTAFGPECLAGTPWRFRCETAFHELVCKRGSGDGAVVDELFDALLDPRLMDHLIAQPHGPCYSPGGYHAHYGPFRRAVEFMRANLHRDIYLDELAHAARLSDRGLRYAFSELLGISPTRYLALLRLHEASRRLSAAGNGRLSVKSVAMSCGWWDLSRFAANYRKAFDEHPSDTLVRACSVMS